jgi:penicillin-binding protein 2
MYLRSDESPSPMNTRLATRVAILGGLAAVLFAVILFRLWYLQVLSGDKYLAEANSNRTREVRVVAPRGEILDRNGKVLVGNRTSLALQVTPQKLPTNPELRHAELVRVSKLAGMSLHKLKKTMRDQLKLSPGTPVTLRQDVDHDVVYYEQENQSQFPGIDIQPVFVRRYPMGTLAAQLFGNVGEVSPAELKDPRYKNLQPGDELGQDGLENSYDRFLRGTPGQTRYQVDSMGQPTPDAHISVTPPHPGDTLGLTISAGLQSTGEAAMASYGLAGGFVVMNIHNGRVLAMGSNPSFDPSVFTAGRGLTQAQTNYLYRDEVAAPLTDRAMSGLYPTGSTFKPITAMAALTGGFVTPTTPITDNGSITVAGQKFSNAGHAIYGTIDLQRALQVSSDVYFYRMGYRMNTTTQLQKWAHRLGIGRYTGIDVPGEAKGLLPTPRWRNRLFAEGNTDRKWTAGDNIQLAVGQGDLQADPLQMAVAYGALSNGGTVVTPHVGNVVQDAAGRIVQEVDPPAQRHIPINQVYANDILAGLHDAAQVPEGTSYQVFGGFPVPVAGKTGTAQRPGHPADQSWYVVLSPYPNPKIVTVVTLEDGGFGADTAAPVACAILSHYYSKSGCNTTGSGGGPVE